ncbi:MAG: ATP-binding protein [Acidimicrobiaceae bacterium]|nr:ATP-binding protein [Acidimicrobiaceae bacterium]
MTTSSETIEVTPSARRLTSSLRDIGYDVNAAVADLIDNSLSAGARNVDVFAEYCVDGLSFLMIADDGAGMSDREIDEAMRFGSERAYEDSDLGKYGLGLKTASLSQARRLTVASRTAPSRAKVRLRCLDLDHIEQVDRWEVLASLSDSNVAWAGACYEHLQRGPGTVVVWDRLDRLLRNSMHNDGAGRRRLRNVANGLHLHLGMVFHRFLEGIADGWDGERLTISVNGTKVRPWNPFAIDQAETVTMSPSRFEVTLGGVPSTIRFDPYVLPARSLFDDPDEFERLSGPRKWNRQQGLYIYRADRLVQSGGWAGIRAIDEHTKLARAALSFGPELDDLFRVNVAKMRVTVPSEIRSLVTPDIGALCKRAQLMYRRDQRTSDGTTEQPEPRSGPVATGASSLDLARLATGLAAAAAATGTTAELRRMAESLALDDADIVRRIGWVE